MAKQKTLVSLVTILALAVMFVSSVSAFADITSVEVNGVEGLSGAEIAAFAGETLPVRVIFHATADESDVRVKAWISGARDLSVSSERFDVLENHTYSKLIAVQVPFDIDPSEDFRLQVTVEGRNSGVADEANIKLAAQRESYIVEILDVNTDSKVSAGETLPVDIVLKNRGRKLAEDTFVKVTIPALGVEQKSYFGDLSAVDQNDPDKEDAAERRMFVRIPSDAPAGVYVVEIEAYNADSVTTLTRKVAVVGASDDSIVVSPSNSKTFAVGEEATYSITLVNTGNRIRVYELVFDTPTDLSVDAEETIVAVPAGSSRTIKFDVMSDDDGRYNFAVDVHADGQLVKKENYVANVEGRKVVGNATVLLTVILAIIFVVLLVVLIVLLTRKPEKKEEFGESYY